MPSTGSFGVIGAEGITEYKHEWEYDPGSGFTSLKEENSTSLSNVAVAKALRVRYRGGVKDDNHPAHKMGEWSTSGGRRRIGPT